MCNGPDLMGPIADLAAGWQNNQNKKPPPTTTPTGNPVTDLMKKVTNTVTPLTDLVNVVPTVVNKTTSSTPGILGDAARVVTSGNFAVPTVQSGNNPSAVNPVTGTVTAAPTANPSATADANPLLAALQQKLAKQMSGGRAATVLTGTEGASNSLMAQ